jgi:hypothetical protein
MKTSMRHKRRVQLPTRANIEQLQAAMSELPQVAGLETKHHFSGDVYARELHIPEGVTLVGKVHKREHLCTVIAGDLTIVSDGKRQRVKAPAAFVSAVGAKRAFYAHEPSIFVTFHRTDSRDLNDIERELVEEDPTALFDARNELKSKVITHA